MAVGAAVDKVGTGSALVTVRTVIMLRSRLQQSDVEVDKIHKRSTYPVKNM